MLIVARYVDEEVEIRTPEGRVITVMVCRVSGERVKLGFQAERDVMIVRRELLDREGMGS